VFEQDLAWVRPGARARIRVAAYPDRIFTGTITYVYPTLTAETRTIPVRIELPNPGRMFKPAMFAQVELPVAAKAPALVVPTSAVIDSGVRRIVLVEAGEGRFEAREVRLGQRGEEFVEVVDGVREAERVVVAANFLIDAESNLKAAIGGFAAAAGGSSALEQPAPAQTGRDSGQPGAAGQIGHKGRGTIEEIDAAAGTVSIGHGPIEALKMPAMTMQFRVANASLSSGLRLGLTVDFEFVERNAGEWVITRIDPAATGTGNHP
jgi:membrane fusion protein, copper/silver efflux system